MIAGLIARIFHDIALLGTEWGVSFIRRKFWITNVRKIVKSVSTIASSVNDCLRHRALSL